MIEAIKNTFKKRETNLDINEIKKTLELIKTDTKLRNSWINYQEKYSWANVITYNSIMEELDNLVSLLEKELVAV